MASEKIKCGMEPSSLAAIEQPIVGLVEVETHKASRVAWLVPWLATEPHKLCH